MRDGDRRRAMGCKAMDELEEFYLLMRHYCLLMGVASSSTRGTGRIDVEDDDDRRKSSASGIGMRCRWRIRSRHPVVFRGSGITYGIQRRTMYSN